MTTKTRSQIFAGFAIVAIVASIGALSVNAQVNEDSATQNRGTEMRAERRADRGMHKEEMQEIMENGDFAAWKTIHEERASELDAFVTEANFKVMQEAHKLRADGDFDAAKALIDESGIDFPGRMGVMGDHQGRRGNGTHDQNGADCPFLK